MGSIVRFKFISLIDISKQLEHNGSRDLLFKSPNMKYMSETPILSYLSEAFFINLKYLFLLSVNGA